MMVRQKDRQEMGGLPGSQMKNSEKNSAERAHRKRIKPKPLDVRGGGLVPLARTVLVEQWGGQPASFKRP